MSVTPTTLTRASAAAAVGAGLLFIGVQVDHPHLDAASVVTTEMVVRSSVKGLMAVLALIGITGMYLRQVTRTGVLGLVGYGALAVGYLLITSTAVLAGFVLPSVAGVDPSYVDDVIAASTGKTPAGDIGPLRVLFRIQDVGYLAGGLLFGIALYRARVLARWAAALLAVSGVVSAALSVMPDAFYRLLALPNGVAMVALGYSLWRVTRADTAAQPPAAPRPRVTAAGTR